MKWLGYRAVLVIAIVLLAAASLHAATVILVNPGRFASVEAAAQAEAAIDWSDPDSADGVACTECFAAIELQHYLRKLTGRTDDFAISRDAANASDSIAVGKMAAVSFNPDELAALGPEGYRIKTRTTPNNQRVWLIAGGGRVGTLYGVYDLLHRLGCRWFAPGEVHEEAPRIEKIGDFDVTERPAFLTRGFLAWEDRGNPDFLLWMARNRLDYWCDADKHHALMHKLGIRMGAGLHDAQPMFLNPSAPYPYAHPLFPASSDKPKDPYPVSSLYQGDADKDGKLSNFEAHPEWFALCDGKRVPGIPDAKQHGANFCVSNPNATAEFIKNQIQALIDGPYRDAEILRLWTIEHARWCECAECNALGTPTDQYLLLVHRLGQEIKKARCRRHNPPVDRDAPPGV